MHSNVMTSTPLLPNTPAVEPLGLTPCEAGQGGSGCAPCPIGTWCSGGNETDPRPECTQCAGSLTTIAAGAGKSADNCIGGQVAGRKWFPMAQLELHARFSVGNVVLVEGLCMRA